MHSEATLHENLTTSISKFKCLFLMFFFQSHNCAVPRVNSKTYLPDVSYPTGIICANKAQHVSSTGGLGQKHGKFPAPETKGRVHGIKNGKCFIVLSKQTHLVFRLRSPSFFRLCPSLRRDLPCKVPCNSACPIA